MVGMPSSGSYPVPSGSTSFFFQAEDGIRDLIVTGVQTCALPILLENDVFACSWKDKGPGGDYGVYVYRVKDNGDKLVGQWVNQKGDLEAEVLLKKIGRASCRERV